MGTVADELRMVGSTVLGLLSGRSVWLPSIDRAQTDWVEHLDETSSELALAEYRGQYERELAGLETVRQRSQFALTALVAVAGFSIAAAEGLVAGAAEQPWPLVVWLTGLAVVTFASLVFAGVFVARKVVGVPDVTDLGSLDVVLARRNLVSSYQQAIETTRATRNSAITVFRDGVLIGLLGLAFVFVSTTLDVLDKDTDPGPPTVVHIDDPCPPGGTTNHH